MPSAITSNYSETVLTIISREYGPMKNAAKILARHAKASYRTAEGWLAGRSAPTGANFMNLLTECEALADVVTQLISEKSTRG